MGFLNGLFSKKESFANPIIWDMHNHILFGIDDGSKTIENSLLMARQFVDMGYTEVIATPHIMSNYYPNDKGIIEGRANLLKDALLQNGIPLELKFAAEYYIDEYFLEKVSNKEPLLTFRDNHVLVETSFLNKPVFFSKILFELRTQNYIPVFAHPERYIYFHENYAELEEIMELGVKLQINLLSLIGYYSPMVRKMASWMVQHGNYHLLGTDAHNLDQMNLLKDVYKSKIFNKIDFTKVDNCS